MIDWNLAAKIAGGGFGMVFIILAILAGVVWVTKIVVAKITKGEPRRKHLG